MKILHIITRLIVGGAQENTLLTCEGLGRRGHEVILLTGPSAGPEGSLIERAKKGGYRVMVTPHLMRNPHPYHDLMAYNTIKRLCGELKPDVVHTHSSKAGILGRGSAWSLRNAKRETRNAKHEGRSGKPLVIHTIHGLPFHPYQTVFARRAWIGLERYAARRCDGIICVADAMTRQALAAGVGKPGLFTTIYSGMETGPFLNPARTRQQVRELYNIPPTGFVFGVIARLQPLKGHEDLLATAGQLFAKVPNAHFFWIGDGIYRGRFEQYIKDHKWTGRFTLAGLVPPAEIPDLLPAMDVLVHPSYREGLARALPQALLAGVPVISYDCDGAGEICIDHREQPERSTGVLVKTGDAAGLCSAMIGLADKRALAAAMGARGRELCRTRFAAETMVEQIESLYHQLQSKNDVS